ncbi:NAD(P)H-dependent oxidoreductase [Polycladidibacter stylochi]|uniref:NAD(P)H-dependent oxidoreductase n=1 Tax=Polycladidibacter stylochi TaxID=1807766 RepID=UPI00083729E1|nr:NAD(P)H-dependent oxidoreductase [Pseudovibrio stylochi]
MKNIFIISAHHPYPFSEGRLNAALIEKAQALLTARGCTTKLTKTYGQYDIDQEVANHQWADCVLIQTPLNWMGVPWSFKKYMDEVYTAGMDGRLCNGDGRTSLAPQSNYGMGGALQNTHYMLSITLNAPKQAFSNIAEPFFAGSSLDQLLLPLHLNARFFGMKPLKTFAAFDVIKNPQIEADFHRFEAHINALFP